MRFPRWRLALVGSLAVTAAVLAACGGGGGGGDAPTAAAPTAPAATGGTSFALGTISGFGSIVVGGVRYDDSRSRVEDEDGVSRSNSDLKLGMVVQLNAGAVDRSANTSAAERIRFGSEIKGPMGAVNTAASTVVVLGQIVVITSSTVFEASLPGGITALAALPAGRVLEVHGILDQTSGKITATRIELEDSVNEYRLRGVVSALDSAARTFMIGSERVSYAGIPAASVPTTLANGDVVRVALGTTQTAGAWVATRLGNGKRAPDASNDVHVEGAITAFNGTTSFTVNGLVVDASKATSFPDGVTGIVLGARVEVKGAVVNGVLVATKVEIEEQREKGQRPLELHGLVTAVDATRKTFDMKGVTVSYAAPSVIFKDGTAASLAVGKQVEVYGALSADRTRLEATRVEFSK